MLLNLLLFSRFPGGLAGVCVLKDWVFLVMGTVANVGCYFVEGIKTVDGFQA